MFAFVVCSAFGQGPAPGPLRLCDPTPACGSSQTPIWPRSSSGFPEDGGVPLTFLTAKIKSGAATAK